MSRLSCNQPARGQISLFALLITGLILMLAMSHSQRIGFSIKAGAFSERSIAVDAMLRNALMRVKTETSADTGVLAEGDLNLVYRRVRASATYLSATRITVEAEDEEHLPKPAGLIIQFSDTTIFIKDYRRE